MQVHQQVTQLRKAGKIDEAYALVTQHYVHGQQNPLALSSAYAWVIYALVNREAGLLADNKTTEARIHAKLNQWMREYSRLFGQAQPDIIHTQMMRVILKVSKGWTDFLNFANWFGDNRFDDQAKEGYQMDNGKTAMSILEQYYTAIGAHLVSDYQHLSPQVIAWAQAMQEKAASLFPNNQFIPYRQAKWLVIQGKPELAQDIMIKVVKRISKVAWTWSSLGCIYHESNQNDKAILSFYHAISLARKADEVLKIRVYLADLLAQVGRYDEASLQVSITRNVRTTQNYKITPDLAMLLRADWFKDLGSEVINSPVAKTISAQAMALVGIYAPEKSLNHQRASQSVAHSTDPAQASSFTGKLVQKEGQDFAFLHASTGERVFVSPKLVQRVTAQMDRNNISVKAVASPDKHGKMGLKAIHLSAG